MRVFIVLILIPVYFLSCQFKEPKDEEVSGEVKNTDTLTCYAQSDNLTDTILKLDSTFFQAYNTCDLKTQEEFYSDSLEFFHDKNGLSTSKKDILEGTRKNICGKVTRELVKGSIEVSPIPGYGAVELGSHMFHNNQEKNSTSHPSKFVIVWRNKNGKWTITKVISLH